MKDLLCALHGQLPRNGLVAWTSGQPVRPSLGRGLDGDQGLGGSGHLAGMVVGALVLGLIQT